MTGSVSIDANSLQLFQPVTVDILRQNMAEKPAAVLMGANTVNGVVLAVDKQAFVGVNIEFPVAEGGIGRV